MLFLWQPLQSQLLYFLFAECTFDTGHPSRPARHTGLTWHFGPKVSWPNFSSVTTLGRLLSSTKSSHSSGPACCNVLSMAATLQSQMFYFLCAKWNEQGINKSTVLFSMHIGIGHPLNLPGTLASHGTLAKFLISYNSRVGCSHKTNQVAPLDLPSTLAKLGTHGSITSWQSCLYSRIF